MTDMKDLMEEVSVSAKLELERANNSYPPFHSPHEGYAIMREEYEEAAEELMAFEDIMHNELWKKAIRNDKPTKPHVNALKWIALKAAAESVQLAAMCQKYLDSIRE